MITLLVIRRWSSVAGKAVVKHKHNVYSPHYGSLLGDVGQGPGTARLQIGASSRRSPGLLRAIPVSHVPAVQPASS